MKDVICDKCGTKMDRKQCDGTFGVAAELYTCHKCGYAYETGIRYNPFIQDYVKYYKYLNYKKKNDFDDDVIDDNDDEDMDDDDIDDINDDEWFKDDYDDYDGEDEEVDLL